METKTQRCFEDCHALFCNSTCNIKLAEVSELKLIRGAWKLNTRNTLMAAAKLASTRQSIASSLRSINAQAVHVKIHPRPRNLAESREVLRVLQQYGEVVMYKHLRVGAPAHGFLEFC